MNGATIRQKLRSGERVYGTHVVSLGNPVAARINTDIEMDFAFICTEHMPIDYTEVSMMCQFYAAHGISPIVRISQPSGHLARRAIDAGAEGIVAPYVETLDQVKELVGAVRFRPIKGRFLHDILKGVREPNDKLKEFFKRFSGNNYLIIGIESVEAINNLEILIADDGVDGVFLGPHDITCSMEIPEEYENPLFIETIKDVIDRSRKMGKGVGFHGDIDTFLGTEMNFILNKSDTVKARTQLNNEFRAIRKQKGDIFERHIKGDAKGCIE